MPTIHRFQKRFLDGILHEQEYSYSVSTDQVCDQQFAYESSEIPLVNIFL